MGVGNGQMVEQALDASVLAETAVQRVEDDVRAQPAKTSCRSAPASMRVTR